MFYNNVLQLCLVADFEILNYQILIKVRLK